jgi:hypothetical protein
MRKRSFAVSLAVILLCLALPAAENPVALNTLTDAEKAAGWKLLFDGKTTAGWRNFKKPSIVTTNGWVVEDGWLKKAAGKRGGDIITQDQFSDFELQWEWRIPRRANNGIKYFITEERGSAIGHEYQMIDDDAIGDPKSKTASFYAILPPKDHPPVRLAPETNLSRLVVRDNRVEHWLNGEKVLEYDCGSEEVLAAVAKSKFKNVQGFGTKIKGHILLTDHNDEASYRNLKVRELPAK